MIVIRGARQEDALILANAEKAVAKVPGFLVSKPDELEPENFKKKIESLNRIANGKYIVAEKSKKIVGHAMLDPMGLEAVEHVVRLTIVVHSGNEEGIGEHLLSHLIEWEKTAPKVEKIELNVRTVNTRAIRLYQKLGFNIEGRMRNRVKRQPPPPTVVSLAIGKVISTRKEILDDNWNSVKSYIELDSYQFSADATKGLNGFSHAEIIFFMNQVDVRKNRPNQIGTTICRIIRVEGLRIYVEGLDAIDGTPVLDIKPWAKEFGPRTYITQPSWMTELMKGYWSKNE